MAATPPVRKVVSWPSTSPPPPDPPPGAALPLAELAELALTVADPLADGSPLPLPPVADGSALPGVAVGTPLGTGVGGKGVGAGVGTGLAVITGVGTGVGVGGGVGAGVGVGGPTTTTGPKLTGSGAGPEATVALNVTVQVPAGSCDVPVHRPFSGVPGGCSDNAMFSPATDAVTLVAGRIGFVAA